MRALGYVLGVACVALIAGASVFLAGGGDPTVGWCAIASGAVNLASAVVGLVTTS